MTSPRRLVVASNRGPLEWAGGDARTAHRAPGGLITILRGALGNDATTWVAAAVGEGDKRAAARAPRSRIPLAAGPVDLRLLTFPPAQFAGYYERTANHTLWFLHHHLVDRRSRVDVDPAAWEAYEDVNRRFATACAEEAVPGGEALIVDYHLALVPATLRDLRPDVRMCHLTACPWADPAVLALLPDAVARRLVEGMLGADVVAFLAARWAAAFLACCRALGHDVDEAAGTVRAGDGRTVLVASFPIGTDADELRAQMRDVACARARDQLAALAAGRRLLVRVDRMDPAKNVLRGLDAYERLLATERWTRGAVVHYVLAYETRGGSDYRSYAAAVSERAAVLNRRFATPGWTPLHLETVSDIPRATAALSLADVVVVNTLRDGMNLIAKEAAVVGRPDAALILSREAGAAPELAPGALLVDPFDVPELARAMATALRMPEDERRRRMAALRGPATALPPRAWLDRLREALATPV
jgi:trehalose 6-phosphate synthase